MIESCERQCGVLLEVTLCNVGTLGREMRDDGVGKFRWVLAEGVGCQVGEVMMDLDFLNSTNLKNAV